MGIGVVKSSRIKSCCNILAAMSVVLFNSLRMWIERFQRRSGNGFGLVFGEAKISLERETAEGIEDVKKSVRRAIQHQLSGIYDYHVNTNTLPEFERFVNSMVDRGRVGRKSWLKRIVGDPLPALPERFSEEIPF